MREELGFQGNQYNTMLTTRLIGYAIGQIPSNLILTRLSPRYWLPFCEVCLLWLYSTDFISNNRLCFPYLRLLVVQSKVQLISRSFASLWVYFKALFIRGLYLSLVIFIAKTNWRRWDIVFPSINFSNSNSEVFYSLVWQALDKFLVASSKVQRIRTLMVLWSVADGDGCLS